MRSIDKTLCYKIVRVHRDDGMSTTVGIPIEVFIGWCRATRLTHRDLTKRISEAYRRTAQAAPKSKRSALVVKLLNDEFGLAT